jgi:hypothetical protein
MYLMIGGQSFKQVVWLVLPAACQPKVAQHKPGKGSQSPWVVTDLKRQLILLDVQLHK